MLGIPHSSGSIRSRPKTRRVARRSCPAPWDRDRSNRRSTSGSRGCPGTDRSRRRATASSPLRRTNPGTWRPGPRWRAVPADRVRRGRSSCLLVPHPMSSRCDPPTTDPSTVRGWNVPIYVIAAASGEIRKHPGARRGPPFEAVGLGSRLPLPRGGCGQPARWCGSLAGQGPIHDPGN